MSGYAGGTGFVNFQASFAVPRNIPVELRPVFQDVYDTFQKLVSALTVYGGLAPRDPNLAALSADDTSAYLAHNVHRFYAPATETIAQGAAINLFLSSGKIKVRNANATDNTKPCRGFCSNPGGIVSGKVGEIIIGDGMNVYLSSLIVGDLYYLSTTNGLFTATAPGGGGNLVQPLGIALTTTSLLFNSFSSWLV